MRQPKVIVSIQHLGRQPRRPFQILHGLLELPQSQFAVSTFKIEIRIVRRESQPLGTRGYGFSVLPPCRLGFRKLQDSLDTFWICCEALAGIGDAWIVRKSIELAPETGRNLESAMFRLGGCLRRQRGREYESGYEEKHGAVN